MLINGSIFDDFLDYFDVIFFYLNCFHLLLFFFSSFFVSFSIILVRADRMSSFLFEMGQVECAIATASSAPNSPAAGVAIASSADENNKIGGSISFRKNLSSSLAVNYQSYLTEYIDDQSKLLLLLDYDGTLAPIVSHPDLALLNPETRRVLTKLSLMPSVSICVMSGRSLDNLQKVIIIINIIVLQSSNLKFVNCHF